MIRTLIMIIAVLCLEKCLGQITDSSGNEIPWPTKRQLKHEARNHNCARQTNKSFTERLKNYPFDSASEILLVSFKETVDSFGEYLKSRLPTLNDTVCISKLYEVKPLTLTQIDKLSDIFYNYGFVGKTYIGTETMCYNPRNAVIFIDKNGKALEFIEICFECRNTRQSSERISLGQMCDQKLEMIKDIFKQAGIEYGVTKVPSHDNQ